MLFNPRYGALGTVALPYFLVFEMLGPVVEFAAVLLTITLWSAGLLNLPLMPYMIGTMIFLGLTLSLGALALEDVAHRKYRVWRHIGRMIYLSLAETIGFRQINSWWRIEGLWLAIRNKNAWGTMTRTGAAAGNRQNFGGGRYWSLRDEVAERVEQMPARGADGTLALPVSAETEAGFEETAAAPSASR